MKARTEKIIEGQIFTWLEIASTRMLEAVVRVASQILEERGE